MASSETLALVLGCSATFVTALKYEFRPSGPFLPRPGIVPWLHPVPGRALLVPIETPPRRRRYQIPVTALLVPEPGFYTHGLLVSTLGYHLTLPRILRIASSMSDAPKRVKGSPGEPGEAAEIRSSPGSPGHLPRLPREVVR